MTKLESARTKVIVAIPTFNRSRLLREALDSAMAQDFSSFQVVVLDNGSTDDTEAVVTSVADPRVTYLRSETNQGLLRNWNRAIEVNSSPYLTIFGDDDLLLPGFIRESARSLEKHPRLALCFSPARYVDADRRRMGYHRAADMPAGVSEGFEWLHLAVAGRRVPISVPPG
jgi:glycosyltransferase involved in cell wall biosynthesis